MAGKLTEAQRHLLMESSDECGTFCDRQYKPASKLVSLGLATWEDDDPESDWLNITPAGRSILDGGGK